ncbi:cell wall hydrolase [Puniceicoccaceae bacterium K14]|nr:cell wall hydrolase [Puniceicoccaceae bacterium K14]
MKWVISIATFIVLGCQITEADSSGGLSWERQIIAACLVLEASDQGENGMRGVASVIHNRAEGTSKKFIGVVKKPYAFTSLNAASTGKTGGRGYADHVRRASRDRNWKLACAIVNEMYGESWADITYGADHYVRSDVNPRWSHEMSVTTIIGEHMFFSSIQ